MKIPDSLWQRPQMIEALRKRDMGHVFRLVCQYAGASQTQIAIACGSTQPKISDYMRGIGQVEDLAVFERIANGLDMPDIARVTLGLAPRTYPLTADAADIPSRDTRSPSSILAVSDRR